MKLENLLRQVKMTKGIGDIFALGSGLAQGYCHSQKINLDNSLLDNGLKFGPLVIQTGIGASNGLLEGISDEDNQDYSPFILQGSLFGLGLGAIEMGLGYCIGYTLGEIIQ